jgi:hypothetical protein
MPTTEKLASPRERAQVTLLLGATTIYVAGADVQYTTVCVSRGSRFTRRPGHQKRNRNASLPFALRQSLLQRQQPSGEQEATRKIFIRSQAARSQQKTKTPQQKQTSNETASKKKRKNNKARME